MGTTRSLRVRQSKTALDSRFHIVDSRVKKLNSGFFTTGKPRAELRIPNPRILGSTRKNFSESVTTARLAQLGGHQSAEWKVVGSNHGRTNSQGLSKTVEIMPAVIWDLASLGGDVKPLSHSPFLHQSNNVRKVWGVGEVNQWQGYEGGGWGWGLQKAHKWSDAAASSAFDTEVRAYC